jgi:hypothetical protein
MTQTLSSWGGQLRPLAQDRQVIVYEARGQGQTELAVADVGPPRHVDDFAALMDRPRAPAGRPVRLLVRRPASPSRSPRAAPSSCAGSSSPASAPAAARSAGSSSAPGGPRWPPATSRPSPGSASPTPSAPPTSTATRPCSPRWSRPSRSATRYAGIRALFEQTLGDDEAWPWHPTALAPQITCPALLLAGEHDRLAPAADLAALAALFPTPAEHHVVPDVGHTVPIEAPEVWRDARAEVPRVSNSLRPRLSHHHLRRVARRRPRRRRRRLPRRPPVPPRPHRRADGPPQARAKASSPRRARRPTRSRCSAASTPSPARPSAPRSPCSSATPTPAATTTTTSPSSTAPRTPTTPTTPLRPARAVAGGGRASARETVGRVAAGALAEDLLAALHGVEIVAWVDEVAGVVAPVDPDRSSPASTSTPAQCAAPTPPPPGA